MASLSPITFWVMERVSPSHVGKGGFPPMMRLATAIGLLGGLHVFYQRSCSMPIPFLPFLFYFLIFFFFFLLLFGRAHISPRPILRIHRKLKGG